MTRFNQLRTAFLRFLASMLDTYFLHPAGNSDVVAIQVGNRRPDSARTPR